MTRAQEHRSAMRTCFGAGAAAVGQALGHVAPSGCALCFCNPRAAAEQGIRTMPLPSIHQPISDALRKAYPAAALCVLEPDVAKAKT